MAEGGWASCKQFQASNGYAQTMPSTLTLPKSPTLKPKARVWVGYSGGLDSTALLHRLNHSALKSRLRAVHVHHGLQAVADEWAQRCEAQCREWQIPFQLLRVQIDPRNSTGPEAAARDARYAAMAELMQPGDVLVTAHHQDDQAETVLLNLLRGAGVEGLAAMRECEPFAAGLHWRPLLQCSRESLRVYATQQGLRWIEDPHNTDPRYARSFLRNEIMPRLRARWPQTDESLARAASNCRDSAELIQQQAESDLQTLRVGEGLSVAGLLSAGAVRANAVLRYWIRQHLGYAPDRDSLLHIEREILRAKPDAAPRLRMGEGELRRYRDRLVFFASPLPEVIWPTDQPWNAQGTLRLPSGCGELRAPKNFKAQQLVIRVARGSERIKLVEGRPSRTLKNLFQEAAVPPWVRQRVPLIYVGEQLICVGCRWWAVDAPKNMRRMVWLHNLPGWNNDHEEREK